MLWVLIKIPRIYWGIKNVINFWLINHSPRQREDVRVYTFSYLSTVTYDIDTHQKCLMHLGEALLMSTHNMFLLTNRKISVHFGGKRHLIWSCVKNASSLIYVELLQVTIIKCTSIYGLRDEKKMIFGHMQTAKAQISLHICTFWSGPSLSTNRLFGYYRMYEWRAAAGMILCTCAG